MSAGEQTDPGQPRPRLRKHAVSPGDLRHPTEGTDGRGRSDDSFIITENIMSRRSKSVSVARHGGAVDNASKAARDNRSRQLNPQHDTYWRNRGHEGRPDPSPDGFLEEVPLTLPESSSPPAPQGAGARALGRSMDTGHRILITGSEGLVGCGTAHGARSARGGGCRAGSSRNRPRAR